MILAEVQDSAEKTRIGEEILAEAQRNAKGAEPLFENLSLILKNSDNNKDYEG